MSFRKLLFWAHLVVGVVSGLVVGIMCVTGVVIAFEDEIMTWAESARRHSPAPADAPAPLPLDALLASAREARPDARFTAISIPADREVAPAFQIGREGAVYVETYTGEVRPAGSAGVHDFLHLMEDWHRALGSPGGNRDLGRAITGASNLLFLVLLVSGLYLWMPRRWTRKALRPALWFVRAKGRARDWNWHNVIGLWTAPVLLVLIVSGVVISYPWASNLVYRLAGEPPPPPRRGPPGREPGPPAALSAPAGAPMLTLQDAVDAVAAAFPGWEAMTLRLPEGDAPAPLEFSLQGLDSSPVFWATQVRLDPYDGRVISASALGDQTPGRQARLWLRFLHTGAAFGFWGKVVAVVASAGGAVLVWTGFAMAIVRWRNWRARRGRKSARGDAVAAAG